MCGQLTYRLVLALSWGAPPSQPDVLAEVGAAYQVVHWTSTLPLSYQPGSSLVKHSAADLSCQSGSLLVKHSVTDLSYQPCIINYIIYYLLLMKTSAILVCSAFLLIDCGFLTYLLLCRHLSTGLTCRYCIFAFEHIYTLGLLFYHAYFQCRDETEPQPQPSP